MSRIVVLGATGTLGLPTCRYLKENGYEVVAAENKIRARLDRKDEERVGLSA